MLDEEEERTFTRQQLDNMKVMRSGVPLHEFAGPKGEDIVVDVLDGVKYWIQYDRKHRIYRCAQRAEASPYERHFRTAD